MDAPTDADSTIALGQHYSVFFIRAATAAARTFFDSPPDSGYSLDNLAPGTPRASSIIVGSSPGTSPPPGISTISPSTAPTPTRSARRSWWITPSQRRWT